ncbi:hypothetical protein HN371_13815 [Candidatus Poribacteria bacterium]|jgi:hypothetical protein|nr:hypothetical protein [Candidatus Poribacteria bacterium]MBT5533003.1 hypothetical protein [Candidatus Poribacteria bacterium]MBT5713927.1 hypothetical protein [Candidatus Poribacteria bacterium]MBT7099293.1 hypothetical protein [Candidatus Poribacteria bacterium]MBT7804660.1 hypothetical protein [Candidatus Poribacteria bacterium]
MNLFVKILAWIAIIILGWKGLALLLGTVLGLVGLLGALIGFTIKLVLLACIAYAILWLYRRVKSEA